MKGLRNFKYISDLKRLIGQYNPRKHNKEFLLGRLESYFSTLNHHNTSDFIKIALRNHTVTNTIHPLTIKSNIYIDPTREFNLPIDLILKSFSMFCLQHKQDINFFYQQRRHVESCVVNGKFKEALSFIELIENKLGKSIWSIDMRMNIYARKPDSEAKDYKEGLDKEGISHLSTLIHRKYTSSSLNLYIRQVLGNLLIEYRGNGLNRYADFLSVLLIPDFVDEDINIHDLLLFSQRLCPVDTLLLINKLTVRALSNQINSSEVLGSLIYFANTVKDHLDHSSWENIGSYTREEISPRVDQITRTAIEKYSSGDYPSAIESCKEALNQKPLDLSVLDIFVRSVIFSEDTTDIEDITANVTKVSNQLLVSLVHVHNSVSNFELHSETFELVFFKYLNFDFVTSIKPMFYAAYHYKNRTELKKACIELFCSEYQITPKYISYLEDEKFTFKILDSLVTQEKITSSRKLRAELESLIVIKNKSNNDIKRINELLEILSTKSDILQSEYYYLWYQGKESTNQFGDILKEVATKLIENSDNQHLFPLLEIIQKLEEYREDYTSNLQAVIVYYFYFRLQSFDAKESMCEYFEDFLQSNSKNLASELACEWSTVDGSKEFFLKEVCKPDIMSILLDINSNEELLFERLKVLQELLRLAPENEDFFSDEESQLYEQLYIDILSVEHSSNKIDIDVKGIKKAKFSEYSTYYELFSEFNEDIPKDLLTLFENDSDNGLAKADNAILHFYGRAYDSILNDFIFDDDFGLVRFLSSEIRHGWLPNQIRSVIESFNLITELGADKKYESNVYWRDKYELTVTAEFLEEFDKIFTWFSKEVDQLINIANGWPQVTRESSNRNVAFNMGYDFETLKDFKEYTKSASNSDEFFNLCSEFMWRKLDEGFRIMRSLINKELKPKFNELYDELTKKFNGLGIELTLLNNEILHSKTKTIEEISIIEGWFCRPESRNIGSVQLQDIIKVSVENTKGIYNPRELVFDIQQGCLDIEVEQSRMLSVIRALVTAFQNSIKYGQKNNGVDISFSFINDSDSFSMMIGNNITEDTYNKASAKNVVERVENYNKKDEKQLLVTEGGTGLYKIFRFIKDAYTDAEFRIELTPNLFTQIITLKV